MAILNDLIVNGLSQLNGLVNGRDIAADGEKLDSLSFSETNFRYEFDVCASATNITVIPQSSAPRFRNIRLVMTAVTFVDGVTIPTSIYVRYYDKSGTQQTASVAVSNSIGIANTIEQDLYADLSQGAITIEASQELGTSHIYELYLDIR